MEIKITRFLFFPLSNQRGREEDRKGEGKGYGKASVHSLHTDCIRWAFWRCLIWVKMRMKMESRWRGDEDEDDTWYARIILRGMALA